MEAMAKADEMDSNKETNFYTWQVETDPGASPALRTSVSQWQRDAQAKPKSNGTEHIPKYSDAGDWKRTF